MICVWPRGEESSPSARMAPRSFLIRNGMVERRFSIEREETKEKVHFYLFSHSWHLRLLWLRMGMRDDSLDEHIGHSPLDEAILWINSLIGHLRHSLSFSLPFHFRFRWWWNQTKSRLRQYFKRFVSTIVVNGEGNGRDTNQIECQQQRKRTNERANERRKFFASSLIEAILRTWKAVKRWTT